MNTAALVTDLPAERVRVRAIVKSQLQALAAMPKPNLPSGDNLPSAQLAEPTRVQIDTMTNKIMWEIEHFIRNGA